MLGTWLFWIVNELITVTVQRVQAFCITNQMTECRMFLIIMNVTVYSVVYQQVSVLYIRNALR